MLDSQTVKSRLIVSIASNTVRSAIVFFSGLLIARGLNPSGYGDMMFLLGSFTAIRSLFDMGTSTAFYTFISQRRRSRRFYLYYFFWLSLQFIVTSLLVATILPRATLAMVWLGHSREVILLAFGASFMQQQVWQTFNQIGEASRKTIRVQIIVMALGIVHLILITLLLTLNILSVSVVFWVIIGEYLVATLVGSRFIREQGHAATYESLPLSFRQTLSEYWVYCRPLAALSWFSFFVEFIDRWLLQLFGGADQQGYYQIAFQFSAISLIATSSIINVIWKEIAEANEHHDAALVAAIYHKVNKGLVMVGAIISGLLIPWTDQIVSLFLGNAYALATPVLLITFLFPIHQSMGQIGTTMLLASGLTHTYMILAVISTLISIPLTYFILAPPSGTLVPGLGLGAIGMALKLVILAIISANTQAWVIARHGGWKFEWIYQVVGVGSAVSLGYASKYLVQLIWFIPVSDRADILFAFLTTGILYACAISVLVYFLPWLIAMQRQEIREMARQLTLFRK